jgi:toxin FitB
MSLPLPPRLKRAPALPFPSPGDARLAPADAARLLDARFSSPQVLGSSQARRLPDALSRLGIAGGAVYDALVALAAKEHGTPLATRDSRARGTYEAVGVPVIVVTSRPKPIA